MTRKTMNKEMRKYIDTFKYKMLNENKHNSVNDIAIQRYQDMKEEQKLNEPHKPKLDIFGVINRTFKCNRCGTIYTLIDGDSVGCCVMPVEHRTSGICGGELIEVI